MVGQKWKYRLATSIKCVCLSLSVCLIKYLLRLIRGIQYIHSFISESKNGCHGTRYKVEPLPSPYHHDRLVGSCRLQSPVLLKLTWQIYTSVRSVEEEHKSKDTDCQLQSAYGVLRQVVCVGQIVMFGNNVNPATLDHTCTGFVVSTFGSAW